MHPRIPPDESDETRELIARHRELLVSEATMVLREHPHADPVAMIIDSDSAAGRSFIDRARAELGSDPSGFIGVMPRKMALEYLRPEHPALLDWVPDSRPPEGGRILPVVALTGLEAEFGTIDLGEAI